MTQLYLLKTIFAKSKEEINKFSKISNERLLSSANALYEILDNHKIPYIKAWSAIFVFVDCTVLLDKVGQDDDRDEVCVPLCAEGMEGLLRSQFNEISLSLHHITFRRRSP